MFSVAIESFSYCISIFDRSDVFIALITGFGLFGSGGGLLHFDVKGVLMISPVVHFRSAVDFDLQGALGPLPELKSVVFVLREEKLRRSCKCFGRDY